VQGIVDVDTAASSAKDANDNIYRTFAEPYSERFAFFPVDPAAPGPEPEPASPAARH
jgi:hypothetical protein